MWPTPCWTGRMPSCSRPNRPPAIFPVEAVEAMARITLGAEQDRVAGQPLWLQGSPPTVQAGHHMALATLASSLSLDNTCGIAILTKGGQAVTAISHGAHLGPIWALSDDQPLLNQMTILRGVRPLHYLDESPQHLHCPLVETLQRADQLHGIQTLLISRLDALEGAGPEDVCRLVPCPVSSTDPVRSRGTASSAEARQAKAIQQAAGRRPGKTLIGATVALGQP